MHITSKFRDYYDAPLPFLDDGLKFHRDEPLRLDLLSGNDPQRIRIERTHASLIERIGQIHPAPVAFERSATHLPSVEIKFGLVLFAGAMHPFASSVRRWTSGKSTTDLHFDFCSLAALQQTGTEQESLNGASPTAKFFSHTGSLDHLEHCTRHNLPVAVFEGGQLAWVGGRLADLQFWRALSPEKAHRKMAWFISRVMQAACTAPAVKAKPRSVSLPELRMACAA